MCYPIDKFRDCINVKYENTQNTSCFFPLLLTIKILLYWMLEQWCCGDCLIFTL